jgi:hypothetical protein
MCSLKAESRPLKQTGLSGETSGGQGEAEHTGGGDQSTLYAFMKIAK